MEWQFGIVRIIRLSCYAETMHILHKDINASFVLETKNVSQAPSCLLHYLQNTILCILYQ
jgi:hypothetical protein